MIIVVTGPECSGKSTLTDWLGKALNAKTVAEQLKKIVQITEASVEASS